MGKVDEQRKWLRSELVKAQLRRDAKRVHWVREQLQELGDWPEARKAGRVEYQIREKDAVKA